MNPDTTAPDATSHQTTNTQRLLGADLLLTDWNDLLARHAHIHPPEAARLLDVPEAALTACRIGSGAVRLKPVLPALLKPIENWGRVLCAFSNASGVHMPLGDVTLSQEPTHVVLEGDHMYAQIDDSAITDAYLLIDKDESHGNTRSIQFFDSSGAAVLKVFAFHKTKFVEAEQHLLSLTSSNQNRAVTLLAAREALFDADSASRAMDPDLAPREGNALDIVQSLFQRSGAYEIELVARHARATWTGTLSGARVDADIFHLHEADIRSHLRFAPLTHVGKTRSGATSFGDGDRRFLRIHREEGQ